MQIGLNLALTLEHGGAGAPTLDMTFTGTGNALDSRITFTRASTGTFFNSAGVLTSANSNIPRFDYNPTTLAARGLLIEEQRTNLLTRSEEFNDAAWVKARASISANATTSPAGAATADKLVEDTTATNSHAVYVSRTGSNETTTLSIFAKAAERTFLRMEMSNFATASCGAYFNLTTGAVTVDAPNADYTSPSASMVAVGNGWYRCVLTVTKGSANTTNNPFIALAVSGSSYAYTGDGTSGLFLWGAQLEAGAFPTSYIPTTTTALTRSADVASVNTLSPWYNATSGTLFVRATYLATPPGFPVAADINDGTSNNSLSLSSNFLANHRFSVTSGGVSQADANAGGSIVANVLSKWAMSYATNDIKACANGGSVVTDTSATIPSGLTQLQLGARGGGQPWSGYIARFTYYPRALSAAELQAITA